MSKKLSIYDVSREAGVSFGTVSRALNSRPGVSAATRGRVLEIAERLGYVRSPLARGLATRQTPAIGITVPDVADPFFGPVADAIQAVARRQGHAVMLARTGQSSRAVLDGVTTFAQYHVAGVVLLGGTDRADREVARLLRDVPTVVAMRRTRFFPSVHVDHAQGSQLMVRHLQAQGRERIAYVGVGGSSVAGRERLRGYRAGLRSAGLGYDPALVVRAGPTLEHGLTGTGKLLARGSSTRPDAIFYATDTLALAGLRRLRDAGVRVPDDIAVAGFGNIPYARIFVPSLTTVGVRHEAIGAAAGRILEQLMAGTAPPPESTRVDVRLVVRESTVGIGRPARGARAAAPHDRHPLARGTESGQHP